MRLSKKLICLWIESPKKTSWRRYELITLEADLESVWPQVLPLQLKSKVTWENGLFTSPQPKLPSETLNHREMQITQISHFWFGGLSTLVNIIHEGRLKHTRLLPNSWERSSSTAESEAARPIKSDMTTQWMTCRSSVRKTLCSSTHPFVFRSTHGGITCLPSLPGLCSVLRIHGELIGQTPCPHEAYILSGGYGY